ncbi:Branched-chain-amino-acid aminotransferase 2 [bioreactor metagenome]|uniref:Branched-chain-amino-acid aminotransferase 2 n=1 Tax=bioreactor metagenome TaxID=1076179 RepID=A0A644Z0M4_9ZZZZ
MSYVFPVTKNPDPKPKPDPNELAFGKEFTDHMFVMDYDEDLGWHDGQIVPYGDISISPASSVLHYAQMMFEGMKAYRTEDGHILLFRPEMNARRLNRTNERVCMPQMDEELFVAAVKATVKEDADWVPEAPFTSLYIRPFIIADDPALGVKSAKHFRFMIILCPSGPYYAANRGKLSTTRIFVEDEYIRAVHGGTGYAKVGGNYAGSLRASQKAYDCDCNDVLWLDAIHHKYIEEVGSSNAFFVIGDEVVTAPLAGTILPGITRDSVLTLLREWGIPARERKIAIDEVIDAAKKGQLKEAFASGTAAVISPMGLLRYLDEEYVINNQEVGEISQRIYDTITGIQTGKIEDTRGWTQRVI